MLGNYSTTKDHRIHKGSTIQETSAIIVEDGSSFEDEKMRAEPNLDVYQPPIAYPQALHHSKAQVSKPNKHILEAFQ